ncbi:MAG: hypothetical protein H8E48_05835 [Chloroflexi bacterium]|nr:hypothetical protein [Chloroflexota bacterium]
MPSPTAAEIAAATLSASVSACLEESLGADGAQAALSNLVTHTAEQEAALSNCLLEASLGDTQSALSGVLACLTKELGEDVARVVESGLIPLTPEETEILGACVLSASMTTTTTTDPIVACLEEDLTADLARVVASGGIPLTDEQQTLLGNCVLTTSLSSSSSTSLSESVVACLEASLGTASAAEVASGSENLTDGQQAALGACLLGSTTTETTTTTSTVSAGVLACLTAELGEDVAQVVASAVLPLSAAEEQILGNCVVMDALGLTP